jgi:hypothetical protein
MTLKSISKVSFGRGHVTKAYRRSGLEIILKEELASLRRLVIMAPVWRLLCRVGDTLEGAVLFFVTAGIVATSLLYRLATGGYYEMRFNSHGWRGDLDRGCSKPPSQE